MSKDVLGFFLVVLSAFPMGIAEGKMIDMDGNYNLAKVLPYAALYFFSVSIYLLGFLQIPTKIGFVIGIWEISAVTISVTTAISKHNVKLDKEYLFYYIILIAATYVLGWTAGKIFEKAGI
jgi:hypothetical protein